MSSLTCNPISSGQVCPNIFGALKEVNERDRVHLHVPLTHMYPSLCNNDLILLWACHSHPPAVEAMAQILPRACLV
jgi:hypothetical protein